MCLQQMGSIFLINTFINVCSLCCKKELHLSKKPLLISPKGGLNDHTRAVSYRPHNKYRRMYRLMLDLICYLLSRKADSWVAQLGRILDVAVF